jgi:hypothetical protein
MLVQLDEYESSITQIEVCFNKDKCDQLQYINWNQLYAFLNWFKLGKWAIWAV